DNFAHGSYPHAVGLRADAKPDNLNVFFHSSPRAHVREYSAYSGSSSCRCCGAPRFSRCEPYLPRAGAARTKTKRAMLSSKLRDSFSICSAAADSSVELDADCCTSSRILSMARTTACAPEACSSTAELISWVISVRRLVAFAICEEPTDCSFVAAPISCENLYTSVTTFSILCNAAPR